LTQKTAISFQPMQVSGCGRSVSDTDWNGDYRFGFRLTPSGPAIGYPDQTLEEIAGPMNITRERVRQIQVKAKERLQIELAGRSWTGPVKPRNESSTEQFVDCEKEPEELIA